MKKLTAEKCRLIIANLSGAKKLLGVSMAEECYLQALEIALPMLEQQERGEGGWIEWGGGECPVEGDSKVETRLRCGLDSDADEARLIYWNHAGRGSDVIAYRIIPERTNKVTLKDEMREWLIDECKADMQRYTSDSPRYLVAQVVVASLEACCIIPERDTNESGEQ